MSSFLAPPSLLSAYCAAAQHDPDLRKGTHFRLFPSQRIGFPLAPLQLYKVRPFALPLDVKWYDRRGNPQTTPDLDQAGGELAGWITAIPEGLHLIGVEAEFPTRGKIAIIDNSGRRIITRRSAKRHLVGAPAIRRIRLSGRGIPVIRGWMVSISGLHEQIAGQAPFSTMALPVDAPHWYPGGEGRDAAWQRVLDGSPLRMSRPDQPDGPFDALDADAEGWRVGADRDTITAQVERMLSNPTVFPRNAEERHTEPANPVTGMPSQTAETRIVTSLLLKSMDPGVARYLGLMTRLDDLPDDLDPANPTATAWAAAALFLCDARGPDAPPPSDALEKRLRDRILRAHPQLREPLRTLGRRGPEVRALVTVAIAAPPPDLPDAPAVEPGQGEWRLNEGEEGQFFSRQLLVSDPPLAALAALARQDGGWQSVHDRLALPPEAVPGERRATIILGHTTTLAGERKGLVTDELIPAEEAPWPYRLALSDVFGRFGDPAEFSVTLPPRPPVPTPQVEHMLVPATGLPPEGPTNPGKLKVKVPIPALAGRPLGAVPLATLTIGLDGVFQDHAATGAAVEVLLDLADMLPMEKRTCQLSAQFTDELGAQSDVAMHSVHVVDPRPPRIVPAGVGIVWTSRPGPSEDVELKLRFDGQAQARYRAYIADARALGLELVAPDGTPRRRADIAVEGAAPERRGGYVRDNFRLLSDVPLDGDVIAIDARLPRALETVQFVRIVPESDRGVPADFARCPLVPVAVPSDRKPPSPRIDAHADTATGKARLTIHADGLDLTALAVAEPGLFGGVPAAARPPEYRLKRSVGIVPDPLYAHEVKRGDLALLDTPAPHFEGVAEDAPADGLLPYVRYWYWADVRLPPERRLPPGFVDAVPAPGSVEPADARQVQDTPAVFSEPSPPAAVMLIPPEIPSLADAAVSASVAQNAPGTWTLSLAVSDGPRVAANAVGAPRLGIWVQIDGGDLELASEGEVLAGGELGWSVTRNGAPPASAALWLQSIDPVGRKSPLLKVEAVP